MKIYVDKSKIDGRGIFASVDIKRGKIVCIVKGIEKFKINRNTRDALAHPNWFGTIMHNWVDPLPPFKYANHSCNPSCGVKGKVEIVALRNIKKDEEITVDYSAIEADPRWYMYCTCLSLHCRKIIRSVQFLPKQSFARYLPFVSTFFKNFYLKNNRI